MTDVIEATVAEILDGETLRLGGITAGAGSVQRYGTEEMLHVIRGPQELSHSEPRDNSRLAYHAAYVGERVRCTIETRGSDGTLIGEVEPWAGPS